MIVGERFVTGLDVASTHTCAVVIGDGAGNGNGEGGGLRVLGVGLTPTEGVRDGTVTNLDATKEAVRSCLREAEIMAGREVDSVFVGLPGRHISL